jgi:hypothetical protein
MVAAVFQCVVEVERRRALHNFAAVALFLLRSASAGSESNLMKLNKMSVRGKKREKEVRMLEPCFPSRTFLLRTLFAT